MLLRKLGIREAVFETQFTGPDKIMFTEELKKRLTQQGPRGWRGALVVLPSPIGGERCL